MTMIRDSVTGVQSIQTGTDGAGNTNVINQPVPATRSGVTVSYDLASTQAPTLAGVTMYHYGMLVITIGTGSSLAIQGRMADGATVGNLTAIGPAGTRVVLNAAQLVPANNGLYALDRFDVPDLVFNYTHGTGASTIRGRLGEG